MPDVTVKRVEDFEAIFGGGFRRARAGLGVSSFGLAVIDLPPNFKHFPEHDQTHEDRKSTRLNSSHTLHDALPIFGGGSRRARAGLGVSSFGLAVIDLPPNFKHFPEHDQTHDDQEEVYTVVSGRATLHVGGEEYELEQGVFARVGATEKRKLTTGDEPARILAMGAMPGRVYEPPEFTNEGTKPPSMDSIKSKHATPAL